MSYFFSGDYSEEGTYAYSTIEWICGDYDDAKLHYINNESNIAEDLFEFKVEIPCSRMSLFYQKSLGVVSDDEDLIDGSGEGSGEGSGDILDISDYNDNSEIKETSKIIAVSRSIISIKKNDDDVEAGSAVMFTCSWDPTDSSIGLDDVEVYWFVEKSRNLHAVSASL